MNPKHYDGVFAMSILRPGQGPGTNGLYKTMGAFTLHLNQHRGQDLLF